MIQTFRKVTLEEFTELMMGALSGRDPKETLLAVFTVLSKPAAGEGLGVEGLITLGKLIAVCKEFKVRACTLHNDLLSLLPLSFFCFRIFYVFFKLKYIQSIIITINMK